MSVRGIFTSHSALVGERGTDLAARVLRTGAGGTAPLLALSAGMPSAYAPQTSFGWIEDERITGNAKVTTGGNTVVTQFVVDDANIWAANSVLMNEMSAEYMLVTSIAADGRTVNVIRGFAGTTPATIDIDDTIQSIGSAYAEGSDRPEPVSQKGEERTNYVQIFKNGWAITGTASTIEYLTGSQLAENKQQCFGYHAEDIERAMMWGRKSVTTLNGKQLRTTNGIIPQIEQYGGTVESANSGGTPGDLSMWDLQDFMATIFNRNAKGMPNERIALGGSKVLQMVQRMVMLDSAYNISQGETAYGINVTTIVGFNGKLKLLTHPMMVENALWNSQLLVVHPGLIRKRIKRKTWTEQFDSQKQNNNGRDAVEGYIAIEMGFEVKGASTMGLLKNVQDAVASNP